MAKFKTFTRYQVKALLKHNYRKREHYSNWTIDTTRSKENVIIGGRKTEEEAEAYFEYCWANVHHSNRKDLVAAIGYVITLPEGISTAEERKEFWKEAKTQIQREFDHHTILSMIIHRDENKQHLHVVLLPIVKDEKHGLKFCSRDYLTRKKMKTWHQDLQARINQNEKLGPAILVYTGESERQREAARQKGKMK